MSSNIQVKKLYPDAVLPTRGTPDSAGLDLYALDDVIIERECGFPTMIQTGIAMAIPPGYVGQIWGRSSLECKFGLERYAGIIDSDYRGEIKIAFKAPPESAPLIINKGDRVAQLLIMPVLLSNTEEVVDLEKTQRGEGGFGSTGK